MTPRTPESRLQGLSRLLRLAGSSVLLVAASVFLFQQWGEGSDIVRYLSLGGMTLLLSVAGFVCGGAIRESKSARTLLALTLLLLPIHFAVLGGFVYSQFSWDGLPISVPAFATWSATSPLEAVALPMVATAALAPLAYLSFLTLARSQATALSALYLLANLSLLVPVRTPNLIALLAAALCGGVLAFELKRSRSDPALRTLEGRFCRALLLAPPALMAGRCIMYEPSLALAGALVLVLSVAVHRLSGRWTQKEDLGILLRGGSAIFACFGWLAVSIASLDGAHLAEAWVLPIVLLPCSGLLLLASAAGGREAAVLRAAGLSGAVLVAGANVALFASSGTALFALVVGITSLALGYWSRNVVVSALAGCVTAFALWTELQLAVAMFGLGRWGALALLGTLTIVGAALLERHGDRLRVVLQRITRRLEPPQELPEPDAAPEPPAEDDLGGVTASI